MGLDLTYGLLRREIGRYLGFHRTPANWSANETQDVDDILNSGLRQFYFPPRLPSEPYSHQWSFLIPHGTLSLVADTDVYAMPSDFASFYGDIYYQENDWAPRKIRLVNEAKILALRQSTWNDASEYYPRYAATVVKTSDETAAQVIELHIWPKPDSGSATGTSLLETEDGNVIQTEDGNNIDLSVAGDSGYTLAFRYIVRPTADTSDANVPLGGPEHAEAILSSCLSVAELRGDDHRGAKHERFLEALASAIDFDRRSCADEALGVNSDPSMSDGREYYYRTKRIIEHESYPS